jgi:nicotinamide-nucleotide amidase
MQAEILSIGTELLLGEIVDTNAVFLAQRLAELGISVHFRQTVGDNPARLVAALQQAVGRADLVLCTGGLGPTADDITAEGIATACEAPLALDPAAADAVRAFFATRGRPMTDKQLKQAMMPQGAVMLPNPMGSAPGIYLETAGKLVVAFPGPPQEMEPMWRASVEPRLAAVTGQTIWSRTLRFCGIGEAALETAIEDLIAAQTNPTIAPYAKLAEVHLRLAARAETPERAAQMIAPLEAEIRRRMGVHLYGVDAETLEVAVGRLLAEAECTLAVAESCTGGLLGGRLTNVPGSSTYLLGGVIAYRNAVKEQLLGVPGATLATYGAVSAETAAAMAEGVCAATGADVGVSITGVAGPDGGTPEKPVGLVFFGLARRGRPTRTWRSLWPGDRALIRARAVQQALVYIRNEVLGLEGGGC